MEEGRGRGHDTDIMHLSMTIPPPHPRVALGGGIVGI